MHSTRFHPQVYISYSHDSAQHAEWVQSLAEKLRGDGVDAILDRWDLRPGDDFQSKIQAWIQESDAVLLVLTDGYLQRSQNPATSLGNEVADLRRVVDRRQSLPRGAKGRPRVIPLQKGKLSEPIPKWMARLYRLFFDETTGQGEYEKLLNTLFEREKAPAIGTRRLRSAPPPQALQNEPIELRRLQVSGFRALKELDLEFKSPAVGHGQWTLLLGDNGLGKSSILWAATLAFIAEDLGHGVLAGLTSPLLRRGHELATVEARFGSLESIFTITNDLKRERFELKRHTSFDFPVFGYGSARGSALGGPRRDVELDRPLDSIGTLFGLQNHLLHAESWLQSLDYSSLKQTAPDDQSFFEAVRETLLAILPGVESLEVNPDDILVRGPAVGECSLSSLSDGYLTTLGWVVDLMARWSHYARRAGIEIKGRFNEEMRGMVLIDEIDLHLHPNWQTHVVSDLRRAFPKMSFMATTHNPLTLLGARAGEVHVLRREGDDVVVRQKDLPPGIRADQVLTGVWFGLASTLDEDTQDLLEQHRQMLRRGVERSDPERLGLEDTLRVRLGSYADTSEERLAQETAARYMNERHIERRELGEPERREMQGQILEALRASE